MLEYQNHIPITAGSALVPGGTGHPPTIVGKGWWFDGHTTFPLEPFSSSPTASLPESSHSYQPPFLKHGSKQLLEWDNRFISDPDGIRYGTDSNPAFQPTAVQQTYHRWNGVDAPSFYVDTKSAYNALSSNIIPCTINGSSYMFNITSMKYRVNSEQNNPYYILDIINIAGTMRSHVDYTSNISVGGKDMFTASASTDETAYGPLFLSYSGSRIINAGAGNWSASSLVTNSNFNSCTTIQYNCSFNIPDAGSNINTMSSFNLLSTVNTGYIAGNEIRPVYMVATAYGDLYKY